jgi:hypothetical protein
MMTLKVRNVSEALAQGLWWLKADGQEEQPVETVRRRGRVVCGLRPTGRGPPFARLRAAHR